MTNPKTESFINQEQSRLSKDHTSQELEKAYDKASQENTIKRKLEGSNQTEGSREDTEKQTRQKDFDVERHSEIDLGDSLKTPIARTTQLWQSAPLIRE